MGIQHYRTAQQQAESAQQTEYRLLAELTRRLMAIDSVKTPEAIAAIHDNTIAWSTFAADLALPENPLPDALKAQLISLYIWVEKHSRAVLRDGAAVAPLIDVNKSVMAGLAAQARAAQAAVAEDAAADAPATTPPRPAAPAYGTVTTARRPAVLESI
jgi:flagellar protein FlaF